MPASPKDFKMRIVPLASHPVRHDRWERLARLIRTVALGIASTLIVAFVFHESETFSVIAGVGIGLYYYILKRPLRDDLHERQETHTEPRNPRLVVWR